MPNLAAIQQGTTSALSLANLVLVTPTSTQGYQPTNPPTNDGKPSTAAPPPSLIFHYEGEQAITIESDITDHYAEDNTSRQDQIALRPEIVTTQGFIGELNNVVPGLLAPLKFAADKLSTINTYVPQLSQTALNAYNIAFFNYQSAQNTINAAVSAWSSLTGGGGTNVIGDTGLGSAFDPDSGTVANNQNKQQIAFQQFYGYWSSRTLFNIQTPWAILTNMAILRLRAVQDAETRVISTFEVTFKKIRTAQTLTFNGALDKLFQSRAAAQADKLVNLGTSSGQPSISVASGLSSMGVS